MSEVIITTSTLEVHKDYDINISQRKRNEHKPSFSQIGDGRMSTHFGIPKSIDLLEEVANMNALEKICFFTIKNSIKWDRFDNKYVYQVNVDMSKLSKSQQSKFRAGYALLSAKDLVRRISRGVYMINPVALVPNDFAREFAIWNNTHLETSSKKDNQ